MLMLRTGSKAELASSTAAEQARDTLGVSKEGVPPAQVPVVEGGALIGATALISQCSSGR